MEGRKKGEKAAIPDLLHKKMNAPRNRRILKEQDAEPTLIFKLSDNDVFRCSACNKVIASGARGHLVLLRMIDLTETFELHVRKCHSKKSPAVLPQGNKNAKPR